MGIGPHAQERCDQGTDPDWGNDLPWVTARAQEKSPALETGKFEHGRRGKSPVIPAVTKGGSCVDNHTCLP